MSSRKMVFVAGATGAQGGAVVDALGGSGLAIRALVRDPGTAQAQQLAARGVELAQGDFDDSDSLIRAMAGVDAVFSVQVPPRPDDRDSEVRTGGKLIEAARANGVDCFVHTSVARAGEHESFAGWAERRWWPRYWTSKADMNDLVEQAGFPHWLILKPAYMMDNFIQPKAAWMFPGLKVRGVIETAMDPSARLDLVAAADVGRFAAAAFADPARFHGRHMPLAADSLTMAEIASTIASATGKPVGLRHVSADDANALGNSPGLTESQQWASIEGYKVNIKQAQGHGITLEHFADWTWRMRDRFEIGGQS